MDSPSRRWWRLLLPVALVAAFLVVVLRSHLQMSQTFDEGFHLAAGYRYIECGDFGINPKAPADKVSDTIDLTLSIAGASPR